MVDHATLSDAELVAQARAGDTDSFSLLVRRYEGPLFRVARSRLGRTDWAEDVVQEAFLAAFRGLAGYDPERNFRTWLWTILLHECHRHYHRRASQPSHQPLASPRGLVSSEALESTTASPLERLLSRERSEVLETLLARLSTVQADALRLRFFGGLKFHEIAEAMQCSLSTAKNRVRWGLTQMAQWLDADSLHEPFWHAPDEEHEV